MLWKEKASRWRTRRMLSGMGHRLSHGHVIFSSTFWPSSSATRKRRPPCLPRWLKHLTRSLMRTPMRPASSAISDPPTTLSGSVQPERSLLPCISGVCFHWLFLLPLSHVCAEMADPTRLRMRTPLRLGGLLGFFGGFLLAYQRSSGLC